MSDCVLSFIVILGLILFGLCNSGGNVTARYSRTEYGPRKKRKT